jgi:hypothetical protein
LLFGLSLLLLVGSELSGFSGGSSLVFGLQPGDLLESGLLGKSCLFSLLFLDSLLLSGFGGGSSFSLLLGFGISGLLGLDLLSDELLSGSRLSVLLLPSPLLLGLSGGCSSGILSLLEFSSLL